MSLEPNNTSTLTILKDDISELLFDPIDVIDNPESVAFNISFTWNMPFQQHRFTIRECWILTQSLPHFESQLETVLGTKNGIATLNDMSDLPVLEALLDRDKVQIIFSAVDTCSQGSLRFTMHSYYSEIEDMYLKFRNYPKWW